MLCFLCLCRELWTLIESCTTGQENNMTLTYWLAASNRQTSPLQSGCSLRPLPLSCANLTIVICLNFLAWGVFGEFGLGWGGSGGAVWGLTMSVVAVDTRIASSWCDSSCCDSSRCECADSCECRCSRRCDSAAGSRHWQHRPGSVELLIFPHVFISFFLVIDYHIYTVSQKKTGHAYYAS